MISKKRFAILVTVLILFLSLPTLSLPKEVYDHHFGVEYDIFCHLMEYGFAEVPVEDIIIIEPIEVETTFSILINEFFVSFYLSYSYLIRSPPLLS